MAFGHGPFGAMVAFGSCRRVAPLCRRKALRLREYATQKVLLQKTKCHQHIIFRSKSLSLLIGSAFICWSLYFNKGLIFFKMSMPQQLSFSHLLIYFMPHLLSLIELLKSPESYRSHVVIRLAPSIIQLAISISLTTSKALFGIELAYSHNLLFRLFVGLMSTNPVFLLINLSQTKVLYIDSFYYEYSYLSIFGKESTNPNGHHLLTK